LSLSVAHCRSNVSNCRCDVALVANCHSLSLLSLLCTNFTYTMSLLSLGCLQMSLYCRSVAKCRCDVAQCRSMSPLSLCAARPSSFPLINPRRRKRGVPTSPKPMRDSIIFFRPLRLLALGETWSHVCGHCFFVRHPRELRRVTDTRCCVGDKTYQQEQKRRRTSTLHCSSNKALDEEEHYHHEWLYGQNQKVGQVCRGRWRQDDA